MRPTPIELINAIAYSLKEDIAGELQTGWAKRILSSTLNALDYLKLRWEHGLDILAEDNGDLAEVLEKLKQLMEHHPARLNASVPEHGEKEACFTDTKPSAAIKQMEEQNRSMRQSLVGILEQLDDCGDAEFAKKVRLIVHPYLQRQLARDHKVLVPFTMPKE